MTLYSCSSPADASSALSFAEDAIRAGKLIVLPTDTVYGIGCDAFNAAAISDLLAAKGRGRDMPVPVLVGSWEAATTLADTIPAGALALVKEYWPGELSIVVPQSPEMDVDLGLTHHSIMLRMPNSDIARRLLNQTGPLAVSSANKTGQPPATTAQAAQEQLHDSVAVYLDGGPAAIGTPSTIVDFTQDRPRVLREGAIQEEEVWKILGTTPQDAL